MSMAECIEYGMGVRVKITKERDLVPTCRHSDIDNLQRIFDEHPGEVARVLLELSRATTATQASRRVTPGRTLPVLPNARSRGRRVGELLEGGRRQGVERLLAVSSSKLVPRRYASPPWEGAEEPRTCPATGAGLFSGLPSALSPKFADHGTMRSVPQRWPNAANFGLRRL
jgi:hypothetical protein